MSSIRYLRKLAACVAVLGMLFTQFTVSAFACPALPLALASDVTATLVSADALDATNPQPCHQTADIPAGLCKAHCENGQKNVSGALVPTADFVPAFSVTLPVDDAGAQAALAFATTGTVAPSSPPVLLLNCVFRI